MISPLIEKINVAIKFIRTAFKPTPAASGPRTGPYPKLPPHPTNRPGQQSQSPAPGHQKGQFDLENNPAAFFPGAINFGENGINRSPALPQNQRNSISGNCCTLKESSSADRQLPGDDNLPLKAPRSIQRKKDAKEGVLVNRSRILRVPASIAYPHCLTTLQLLL